VVTPEVVQKVLATIRKRQADYDYFFGRLNSPVWIKPLKEAGLFSTPPLPAVEGQYISFPRWPESEYLARMAATAPDAVLEVALQIPDTENVRVHDDLVNAALAMPADLAAKLVDKAKKWAESSHHPLFAEKLGSLVAHLAQGEQVDEALGLAGVLLAVLPDPRRPEKGDEDDTYRFPPTPQPRFNTWDYRIILKKHIPLLVDADGGRALTLLCDLLQEAMRLSRNRSDGSGPHDHSYIWRRDIDSDSHDDDVRDLLISAVRDATKRIANRDAQEVPGMVRMLEARPWLVFRRLALHLLQHFPEAGADLIVERLTDPSLFGVLELWNDFFLLARDHFTRLTPGQQDVYLSWVESGRDPESFKTPEERRYWQLRHLAPIKNVLPDHWKERHSELVEEFGEIEWPEYVSPPSSMHFGWDSPKSSEDLSRMSFDELIAYLKEWQSSGSPVGPSPEGLGQQLTAVVASEPERFANEVEALKDLDPTYVRAVISGLHEALKQKGTVAWPPILRLCKWVIEQPQEVDKPKGSYAERDPDWNWTKGSIQSLLEEGLKSGDAGIPFDLRRAVWEILLPLTDDPDPTPERERGSTMDPLTLSLNTIRGEAMHGLVRYALWCKRDTESEDGGPQDAPRGFDAMPEVREVLDRHLEPDNDPSLAVRSVYGQWFPWLAQLDQEWVASRLQKIFPAEGRSRDLLNAAWETYVVFNSPYTAVFNILREEYYRAIDRIGTTSGEKRYVSDPDDRLAEHLMILYGRGHISLDDPDGLLRHFFQKAPGDVRGHAIWLVGRDFNDIEGDVPKEVLERLQALWADRINEAQNAESRVPYVAELTAFGGWFASGKFDDLWSITQLKDVLRLAGFAEPYHSVLERLAALAASMPAAAVECLGMMVEGDKKRRYIYSWHEHMRSILASAINSPDHTARQFAEALINRLLARDRAYAGLRDLLSGARQG